MRDGRNDKAELSADADSLPVDIAQIQHAEIGSHKIDDVKKSGKIFITIFDNAADGILVADVQNKKFYIGNNAICKMLGYTNEEIENMGFEDIHPAKELPEIIEKFNKQVRRELTLAKDVPVKRKDGSVFYADINAFPVELESKNCLIGIFRDVTERRNAEESLRQSEEKFRLAMEVTNDALWDWNLVTDQTYRNPRHATMLGYEPDELSSSNEEWRKRIHPDDRQYLFQILNEHLSGKRDFYECEYRLRTKSGDYIWVLGRGKVVERNEDGLPVRMIGTNIDITKQKQTEQSLLESEKHYKMLAETINDGLSLIDENGIKVYVNSKCAEILGYSKDEMIGKYWMDFYDADTRKILREQWAKRKAGIAEPYEISKIRKDGRKIHIRVSPQPIFDKNGEFKGSVAILADITERKNMEASLQQSEEALRSLVNAITESVLLIDKNGIILTVNESCAKRLGGSVGELIGKCCYDFLHPDVKEYRKSKVEQVVRTKRPVLFDDNPPGRIVSSSLFPILDAAGKVAQVAIFGLDITENRRIQQALAESEEKYRTLVETARDPIATIDRNGVFLFMNTTAAEHLGGKPEDFIGKTMWDLFPKNIADRQAEDIKQVIDNNMGVNIVTQSELLGQARWYNITIEPLRDSDNNVMSALMIARDIHNIKQAQEQILKLSSAVEQSIDGIAMSDLQPQLLYVNNAYAQMHGYTVEEMIGMNLEDLHSSKSAKEIDEIVDTIKMQGAWMGELEHIRKDGTTFPIYLSVTLLKTDEGVPIGSIGICKDMTEYKKTQKYLKIRDVAMASSINGIILSDIEGQITYVNRSCVKMGGYEDEKEVLGRNIVEFCKDKDEALEIIKTVHEEGRWIGELSTIKKDGSTILVQIHATLVRDENNKPIAMMASLVDITESRRSQEQLNMFREKMSQTEQLATLGTLSATITHELTQPLTVIRLLLENTLERLQKSSSFPQEILGKKLMDSLNQVSNIVSITERFRNFARRSTDRIYRNVNLKDIAGRIVGALAENARRANILLRIEEMDGLPTVYIEERDLEQLFFAIINNAIQAADGENTRLFVVSGITKNKCVELRFSDNCGGIAPEHIDKIFEPFFTTKPRGMGTGLGLCIVQDVISRTRGKIRVESVFGEGSTFIVTLPINKQGVYDWSNEQE